MPSSESAGLAFPPFVDNSGHIEGGSAPRLERSNPPLPPISYPTENFQVVRVRRPSVKCASAFEPEARHPERAGSKEPSREMRWEEKRKMFFGNK